MINAPLVCQKSWREANMPEMYEMNLCMAVSAHFWHFWKIFAQKNPSKKVSKAHASWFGDKARAKSKPKPGDAEEVVDQVSLGRWVKIIQIDIDRRIWIGYWLLMFAFLYLSF